MDIDAGAFIRGSVRVGVRARPVRNVAPYRSECKVVRIGLRALMVRASLYEGEGRAGPPTEPRMAPPPARLSPALPVALRQGAFHRRSEERRVGKGCVSTCRSRGSP